MEDLRLFRELFDRIRDAVFVMDADKRIRDVNATACERLGYTREELLGRPVQDVSLTLRDPEARERVEREMERAGEATVPSVHRRKDGTTLPVEVSVALVPLDDDHYTVAVARDLSARRRRERREIRAERLAAVGTLASGVAHEFNNINFLVRGYCDLGLRKKDLDPTVRDWFLRIQDATGRASRITDDLLALSGAGQPQQRLADLAAIADEALGLVAGELVRAEVEVVRRLGRVPDLELAADLIGQVVINLTFNAMHSMLGRPQRRLTVETGEEGGRVFLRMEDTGCGIPEENLARVFTPFFSTKGEFGGKGEQAGVKGTGLGLAVCHTIVEQHGGEIEVDSELDAGSRFTVWLPGPLGE